MGSSMMTTSDGYEVILQSTQYDDLKAASDKIVNELTASSEVTRVHSTLENAAPLIKIDVDPVKAAAEGLSPVQVAGMVNTMLSGSTATTLKVNGNDIDVNVEYPDGEYDTLDQVKGIVIPTTTGASVALVDIADISYKDSPLSITRSDKQYQVTITGDYTSVVGDVYKRQQRYPLCGYGQPVPSGNGSGDSPDRSRRYPSPPDPDDHINHHCSHDPDVSGLRQIR